MQFAVELAEEKSLSPARQRPWKVRRAGRSQKNQRGVSQAIPDWEMFDLQFVENIFFF